MAIVADHTMLKFHGRERVKHYILALMNIVSYDTFIVQFILVLYVGWKCTLCECLMFM